MGTVATPGRQNRPKSRARDDMSQHKSRTMPDPDRLTVLETHGYTLGAIIGMGSYATVKLATSTRNSCEVAIKIISKLQAPNDYLKKFLPREIEVVKGLRHPNLIKFMQAIETTHRVYIVMEFAERGSLLDVIRKESYIDEGRSRRWFGQLVNAIEYCHNNGVVHRDIKCENLLITAEYNMKISDFGFARHYSRHREVDDGLSETFCGSYAYASPEILKGVPYCPRMSDIWSMGVVLFAMVYGRLPFDDTKYSQLLKQVQAKVVFPKEPNVSSEVKMLINGILSPVKTRFSVKNIQDDPWLRKSKTAASSRFVSGDSMYQDCESEDMSLSSSQQTESATEEKYYKSTRNSLQ